MKEELKEWIKDIAIALVIAGLILVFFKPIVVKQESMQPTFYSDDYVIISRQAYGLFGDVERGDVIIFESELLDVNGNNKNLIKRVIGLPGDTIEIKDGYVYLNDEKLDEPYVAEAGLSGQMEKVTVEEGKVFAMGDNRRVSQDSRSAVIGQVEQDSIVGKVVLRVFPFNSIKLF
ncbi:MAG: signal peptidase I [Firmicutes bacterium]|nr:signal peptidase I [Bacillota bacterium]